MALSLSSTGANISAAFPKPISHTKASDGIHSYEEIVENAIQHKLAYIDITDHFDTRKCDSVGIEDLDEYISRLKKLKRKYMQFINILTGIELCRASKFSDIESFPYEKLNKLDYVLLEYIDDFRIDRLKQAHILRDSMI